MAAFVNFAHEPKMRDAWPDFLIVALAFLISVLSLLYAGGRGKIREKMRAAEKSATAADMAMAKRWTRETTTQPFFDKKAALLEARKALDNLGIIKQRSVDQLYANRDQMQRQRFLEKHLLEHARIKGIGPGRKAQLASFGITDAADITEDQVSQVTGFGIALANKILAWRREVEAKFRFNAAAGPDKYELAKIESEVATLRQVHEAQLLAGPGELEAIKHQIDAARARLWPERVRSREERARMWYYLKKI